MPVIVLGDECVDQYWVGESRHGSPEDPTVPVVRLEGHFCVPGMAGNVVRVLEALGVEVWRRNCPAMPVKNRLVTVEGRLLARWDENDWCLEERVPEVPSGPAVVICDYGKGAVTQRLVDEVAERFVGPFYVDTKDDPTKFAKLQPYLFPNRSEYDKYAHQYNAFPNVIYKQGAVGISWLRWGVPVAWAPAEDRPVVSTCGAGDVVLGTFVALHEIKAVGGLVDAELQLALCNLVAGIACQRPFTYVPSLQEIKAYVLAKTS